MISGLGRSTGEGKGYPLEDSWASLVAQLVKNIKVKNSLNGLENTLHTAEIRISKLEDGFIRNILSEVQKKRKYRKSLEHLKPSKEVLHPCNWSPHKGREKDLCRK